VRAVSRTMRQTRILGAALFLTSVLIASCHPRSVSVPPVPPAAPAPPPGPIGPPAPPVRGYETADRSFEAGDYPKAARSYEEYLRTETPRDPDWVHFRLGLAYALARGAAQDLKRSRDHFQRVAQFPASPYRAPAELILSLQAEFEKAGAQLNEQQVKIKTLAEELQRLKSIDMQRRPSRPPR
jgi:hypothetical protein